jgi:hypothetical protein
LKDQLTDTSTASRAGSEFVVSAWPNRVNFNRAKWLGYPFVVVTNDVDTENNLTLRRRQKTKVVSFVANVYDKSQANADTVSNQINEILDVAEDGLEGSGLHNYRVISSSTGDLLDPSGALVHNKSINFAYDFIEQR